MSGGHYDIAVIGLGAMGSAALYQLSKLGLNVIGIDQYNPPHSLGSSHGETRVTRQAIGEGTFYTPIVLRANEIWRELEHKTGEQLYTACGTLITTKADHPFYKTTVEAAKQFNIRHELMSGSEASHRFPALTLPDDAAVYFEPAGGYLRPEKCIEVQLKFAKDNRATIRANTQIKQVEQKADSVTIMTNDDEVITARKVIITAGPWVQDFVPEDIQKLFTLYLQTLYWFDIEPSGYELLRPESFPAFLCALPSLETPGTNTDLYGFPAVSGPRGGIKFARHEKVISTRPEDRDKYKIESDKAELFYRELSTYVKGIKPHTIQTMNCLYTVTPDENFIIDWLPDNDNILLASSCSGHGFKHSAAVGEMLAQLVTEGKTDLDISAFSLGRFKV